VIIVKTKIFIILMLIITLTGITATILFYSFYIIADVKEIDMSLLVGDHAGFDVDGERLAFGMVKPASNSCIRYINLSNKRDYPLRIYINFDGNLTEFVSVSDNYFVIKPDEEKKLSFSASAPRDTAYGNYTGTVRFVFKRII